MKAVKILWTVLLLICICTLPIGATQDNAGEEDDFGQQLTTEQENSGEIEELDTTASADEESQTVTQAQTTAPADEHESESSTQKGGTVYPPAREQQWALPIPVIWATIALVGIAGTILAVLFLIKYFKQEQ